MLCVTMHQNDFKKIEQMNIQSDIVFANQCDHTAYDEMKFGAYTAKMISTQTRGVGINRNLSLSYAGGSIILLSDEDMVYNDGYADAILQAFEEHPKADVMIFNIGATGSERKQKQNNKTRKLSRFARMPYGAPRIALRLSAWRKSNVWFTTLFGGGAVYSNGEDSVFLNQLRRAGLSIYVSNVHIGNVDMSDSCWYQGANEEFFFNKGAYIQAMHPKTVLIWHLYFAFRVRSSLRFSQRMKWLRLGKKAYACPCIQSFKEMKSGD